MDLGTIEIDPAEAEAKLAEYEGVLASDRMAEDEAIAAAYRAAKRGMPIIQLSNAVERGGFFPEGDRGAGWPRIAVVRADAAACFVSERRAWNDSDTTRFVFADAEYRRNMGAMVGAHTVSVRVHDRPSTSGRRSWQAQTMVPVIPPNVRPRRPRLSRFHVLWEVEEWTPHQPPRDPALIRHVRGDLWVVQAVWELTELERLVLGETHR